jgi:uncharacterized protein involved in exopolysaccharide biosynthesis
MTGATNRAWHLSVTRPTWRAGAAARGWRLVLACAVIGGIAAFAVTLFTPPRYRAEATIYALPGRNSGIAATLRELNLGGAAGEIASQGATTDMASYLVSVLRSRAVAERVCRRLNLAQRPDFVRPGARRLLAAARLPSRERAAAETLRRAVTAKGDFAGLITIRVAARDPQLASDIANGYLGALDEFMCTAARSKRCFIERQLGEAKAELTRLERALQSYQAQHGSYALDVEAKELIQNWARLSADRLAAQVALRENAGVTEVSGSVEDLVSLRSRRAGLEARSAELSRLECQLARRIATLPEVGLGMARWQRAVAAKQALTEMLESQLELARIAEVEEQARYQVLDRAYPSQLPAWPRRKLSAAAGMLAGLLVGLLAARVWLGPLGRPPGTDQAGAQELGIRREAANAGA